MALVEGVEVALVQEEGAGLKQPMVIKSPDIKRREQTMKKIMSQMKQRAKSKEIEEQMEKLMKLMRVHTIIAITMLKDPNMKEFMSQKTLKSLLLFLRIRENHSQINKILRRICVI